MASRYVNMIKIERCSMCGRRRPAALMIEIGFLVYACRKCLPN